MKKVFCLKLWGFLILIITISLENVQAVDHYAVIATHSADYTSGAHSVVSVGPAGGPRNVQNELLPTLTSDVTVNAYGMNFYRIERYMADSVTKFHIDAPGVPIWQFSVNDPGTTESSNPVALVFESSSKAYLLRYGATTAWIVNPSVDAGNEAGFKTGALDLDSYSDSDGIPEMKCGVIANGKLFVLLQRLDRNNNWIPDTPYVSVFDISTDTEIDTGKGENGLKGVPLPVKNASSLIYLAENNTFYIHGIGKYASSWSEIPADYSGGIISLNPDTYETVLLIDDGDDASHPYGNISGLAIVSPEKGYFVGYAKYKDNTLYTLNPSTGVAGGAVAGLENKDIAAMDDGIYPDSNGMLWVGNSSDAEVIILNTATDTIDEIVDTYLNPGKIVFCGELAGGDDNTVPEDSVPNEEGNSTTDTPNDNDDGGSCFIRTVKVNW